MIAAMFLESCVVVVSIVSVSLGCGPSPSGS